MKRIPQLPFAFSPSLLSLAAPFLFSSRRRHTSVDCDWSADVCSSDLEQEDDEDALADAVKPENNLVPRLGILCIEIDGKIAKLLPDLRQPDGLIVAAKSPDGQGRYIDLKSGDV